MIPAGHGSAVRVGVTPWGSSAPARDADWMTQVAGHAETADQLGFESFWIPESHFQRSRACPAPLLLLAAAAARTRSLRLGTSSYLLPIRDPLRVAEDVAVLDQLSGGRVTLGLGRGFRAELFRAFRIPRAEKRDRFRESLDIMRRAWRGEPIARSGHEPDSRPLYLSPLPAQRPHPPIWVAAFGPKALAQVGGLGLPYLASPVETLERLRENHRRHREALPDGVDAARLAVPVIRTVFITRNPARAAQIRHGLEQQAQLASRRLGQGFADLERARADDWALVGEPDEILERIQRYRSEIGLTHLICGLRAPGTSEAEIESTLHELAEIAERIASAGFG
ncbi:MAG: LLM class flavin-dependent oxidoreductase [Myxococcales bacterium]|nr:LLM class flavin-dependent oxidoreductase [Myxococcales bacterium]